MKSSMTDHVKQKVLEGEELLHHIANTLAPALQTWRSMYDAGALPAFDLVGAFILAWSAIRLRPTRRWVTGPLSPPVTSTNPCPQSGPESMNGSVPRLLQSTAVCDVPGLLEFLNYQNLDRYLSGVDLAQCPIIELFNRLRIKQLKEYVHVSLVHWAQGKRPYRLLFHVPSPVEVLRMQAEGDRVVTLLMQPEQLCRKHISHLLYMRVPGVHRLAILDEQHLSNDVLPADQDEMVPALSDDPSSPLHERDALDFLLHDVKHMENFAGSGVTYREQVGFCRALLCLGKTKQAAAENVDEALAKHPWEPVCQRTPRPFFTAMRGSDSELWGELEYVISDMNCVANHMLAYLKAKWLLAHQRIASKKADAILPFDECWLEFLDGIGMQAGSLAHHCAVQLCTSEFDNDRDIRPIREYFQALGMIGIDQHQCTPEYASS